MIAVIFEVTVADRKMEDYLDVALGIHHELSRFDGFISVERFQSIATPGKLLSLSFWDSEDSAARWRNDTMHRDAQVKGRDSLFADYRLRVGSIIRDYGMMERDHAPNDSKEFHR